MHEKHRAEAVVIGAGPVGLFAACELAKRGIDVQVVDQDWRVTSMSYALGIHPGSIELLEDLDLAVPLIEAGFKVEKVVFYDGFEPKAELDLNVLGGKYPFLTIVPQNWFESALEAYLKSHHVKVEWKHRVTDIDENTQPIALSIERWGEDMTGYAVARKIWVVEKKFSFQSNFVLGADGHASTVRRHLGIDYDKIDPSDLFAVFEFQSDVDADPVARIILDEKTVSILWPLPDGRFRWSFQLKNAHEFKGERVKSRLSELGHWIAPGLDQQRLETLIAERAPWFKARVQELFWSVPIRFERGLVPEFGRGGVWLAGDAAHLASPAGIQSMNVGLREGRDLADRLHAILREGAPPSSLDAYAAERKAEWEGLLNKTGGLRATEKADAFVRANAERILSATPASGAELQTLLNSVGLELGGQ